MCLKEDGDLCNFETLELEPFVQPLPIPPDADDYDVARVDALDPPVNPLDNSTDPKVRARVSDVLAKVERGAAATVRRRRR